MKCAQYLADLRKERPNLAMMKAKHQPDFYQFSNI